MSSPATGPGHTGTDSSVTHQAFHAPHASPSTCLLFSSGHELTLFVQVDIKFTDEAGRPLPANAIAVQQGVEQDGVLPITLVAGNTVKGKVLATVTVNGQPVNNGKPYVLDVTQPHLAVERNCFMKGLVAEEPGVQVYGFQVANQAMQGTLLRLTLL